MTQPDYRELPPHSTWWGSAPPAVWVKPGDFAYGVWQALAVTLAEPLRRTFSLHLEWHGCSCLKRPDCKHPEEHEATGGHEIQGFGHCPEAMALFGLLPEGDRVVVG